MAIVETLDKIFLKLDEISGKLNGGGGGGSLVVPMFTDNNGTWTCDKTYAEIVTAIEAGQCVNARSGNSFYPLTYYEEGYYITFGRTSVDEINGNNVVYYDSFFVNADGTVERFESTYPQNTNS